MNIHKQIINYSGPPLVLRASVVKNSLTFISTLFISIRTPPHEDTELKLKTMHYYYVSD